MSPEIMRIACSLSESSSEVGLLEKNYRSALAKHSEIMSRLSQALMDADIHEAIAISIDDNEVLICVWEAEGNDYSFSLVRSYS